MGNIQTNADIIRNMTNEELAKYLADVTDDVRQGSGWDYEGWLKELSSDRDGWLNEFQTEKEEDLELE